MSLSKPMKIITLRFDEDEKTRLAEMAADQHITLSHALREGARIYLAELEAGRAHVVAEEQWHER